MPHLLAAQTSARFNVSLRTPENWSDKGYIHTFVDQNGDIRYSTEEIESGFIKYGPKKMRDGRKRRGRSMVPIVVAEPIVVPEPMKPSAGRSATGELRTVESVNAPTAAPTDAPEGR